MGLRAIGSFAARRKEPEDLPSAQTFAHAHTEVRGPAVNRVAIHSADTDVYLESNLARADLLAVAGSLPLHGLPLPPSQR